MYKIESNGSSEMAQYNIEWIQQKTGLMNLKKSQQRISKLKPRENKERKTTEQNIRDRWDTYKIRVLGEEERIGWKQYLRK